MVVRPTVGGAGDRCLALVQGALANGGRKRGGTAGNPLVAGIGPTSAKPAAVLASLLLADPDSASGLPCSPTCTSSRTMPPGVASWK